jgi:metal-responsive CopG/Arc/MetJ family transcriptional regulator
MLKRVQLMLDDELDRAVAREARLRRVSRSEVVRSILREKLLPPPLAPEENPLWELVGMVEGAPDDSQRINEVVYGLAHDDDLRR